MTTAAAALEYKQRVLDAVPAERRGTFTPLMTCYLTDNTQPEDVQRAKEVRSVGARCGCLLTLQLPLAVLQFICHRAGSRPAAALLCCLQAGVVAFKLYPAGATTNSDSGVTDIGKCLPTLRAMAEVRLPAILWLTSCCHGCHPAAAAPFGEPAAHRRHGA